MKAKALAFLATFFLHLLLFTLPVDLKTAEPLRAMPLQLSFPQEKRERKRLLQKSPPKRERISPPKKRGKKRVEKKGKPTVPTLPKQQRRRDELPEPKLEKFSRKEETMTQEMESKEVEETPKNDGKVPVVVPEKVGRRTKSKQPEKGSSKKKRVFDRRSYVAEVRAKILSSLHYPRQAEKKGIEGRVVVEVSISPSGALLKSRLIASSHSSLLDKAALKAVQRASPFAPFLLERKTALLLLLPISFRISR